MKAVIFDLDGTLLNTATDLANAVNYALKLHGKKTHSNADVIKMVGNGVKNLIIKALGDDADIADEVLKDFKGYYGEHNADFTVEYDGVTDMLKTLKKQNVLTAIASNKYDGAVKKLSGIYFGDLIDVALGESEKVSRKPNPDMIFKIIKSLGVNACDCVYVGDSDVDIITAKNAGMPCVSVGWGFRDKSFLAQNGATVIAETVPQLTKILLEL